MKRLLFNLLALVMTAMTASAVAPAYKITVGTNDQGTFAFKVNNVAATPDGNGAIAVDEGDNITLTVTPNTGWTVNATDGIWYANDAKARGQRRDVPMERVITLTPDAGNQNSVIKTYTFTMIRANAEISANYRKLLTHPDISIADIASVTYNGKEQKPAVTVKDGSTKLILNTDYTVEYSNNVNAGTATVTITGKGNYDGTVTKNFTINKLTLEGGVTVTVADETYTGNPLTPKPVVSFSGTKLVENTDYSLSYTNNVNAAKSNDRSAAPTVTITALPTSENFSGSISKTFTIAKASFNVSFSVKNVQKTCGDEPFTYVLRSDLEGNVSYSSTNTSVATVDENGTVTVNQAGSAKITGSVFVSNNYNTQEAYYWVEVKSKDIETSNGMNISWDGTKYIVEIKDVTNGEVVPDEVCEAHLTYTRMLNVSGKTTVSTDNNEESYLFTVCLPFKPQFNAKFYTLTNISDTSLEFTEIEGEAKALTPYLVSSQHNVAVKNRKTVVTVLNGEDSSVTAEEVDGMPFTNEEDMSFCDDIVEPTPVDGYQFRGTLRGLSNADAAAEGAFILQSDGTWGAVKAGNENVYIPPFRAYIVGASQNVRKLDSSISSAATGIERIVTIDRDGTERWYDLQGRRIEKPATKGIYIHNGMKVAVK